MFCITAGGIGAGGVGGEPWLTLIWVPNDVVVRVTPWLVTVSDWPNMKFALVAPVGLTATWKMPPRIPRVADGVVTFTSDVLLIAPPTKRSTPFVTVIDMSPLRVAGSKTYLSMTTWLFGPMVIDEPSLKTRCARSSAFVVTRSSASMSMPTCNTRSFCWGGLPSGWPSTTDATPTRDQAGGATSIVLIASSAAKDRAVNGRDSEKG